MLLDLDMLTLDRAAQPRAALDPDTVAEYAAAMRAGAVFPPIKVFSDGVTYWLADGFHRVEAARELGSNTLQADLETGTLRDAILYSTGANAAHGLRRTNADKRRAVLTLLNDPEWAAWSDREIARRCKVDHTTVAELRRITGDSSSDNRLYTTRWGDTAVMDVSRIAERPDPAPAIAPAIAPAPQLPPPPAPTQPTAYTRPTIPMVADPNPPPPAYHPPDPPQIRQYPILIPVGFKTWERWQRLKKAWGATTEAAAFAIALEKLDPQEADPLKE